MIVYVLRYHGIDYDDIVNIFTTKLAAMENLFSLLKSGNTNASDYTIIEWTVIE